ncbi:ectoine/hydroxyectoine ABC transporter permease subunit EhuC [Marinitenerispora sediminis]|uniref:Ectoine/hydroxyectoine ABC transporter permease subunit EhuC n=1 Tax=Marinitenerispora sediminis TaxID=1931232 RepID=A0A368T3G6_9ACTN|nr:ectoine/hydroxyectoine ABC transporter permease subunit EhuC [Marinitenerispora sediminis]RCV49635.1 ectoine/hydroxyectoine ABC transporter permease subunit EhuC [Marinitenerispora sediminis]RCV53115.1 ectoine/hydroxyectoine ABC transporter permease subunit EhuC [Marinitenerispora sediminis]RCV57160.1 ectoine/hydroxyectoine ABC transporter permease subunit EhuC [Marinitenerispora sediminis]
MNFFVDALPLYLNGARYTLLITVGGCALAFAIAMAVGILGSTRSAALRALASVYVEVFRGVAALVLMFWLFYAMPLLTGYRLEPVFAAILALGLNIGAYGAENVRGAIKAVPRSQYEATVALNLSWTQRMRLVVLPQAWAQMLPTFGNLVIELMKGSAVVSLIAVSDITFVAQQLRTFTGETVLAFAAALVTYFVIAQVFVALMRLAERSANRRLGRIPARPRRRAKPAGAAAKGGAA